MRKALTIKLLLTSSLSSGAQEFFTREVPQDMRTIFFCIVSSAENSSLEDLSRIVAQQKFISEQNWQMTLPIRWEMYGDGFELRRME